MATPQEASEAVLDELVQIARNPRIPSNAKSLLLLRLAEAHAWLQAPDQPHGGTGNADIGRASSQ